MRRRVWLPVRLAGQPPISRTPVSDPAGKKTWTHRFRRRDHSMVMVQLGAAQLSGRVWRSLQRPLVVGVRRRQPGPDSD